jgi:peptide/nickel transport system ATP-binding protein
MLELQDLFDTSYLFISHDLANARYLAGNAGGRIGVMYLGQIIEIGPVEEILQNPQHPYTKVLMWATADLEADEETGEAPIRGIDIPDATNPPSGCRFHTRCPEAREVCTERSPDNFETAEGHETACFRVCGDDHPYWESEPITDDEGTNP